MADYSDYVLKNKVWFDYDLPLLQRKTPEPSATTMLQANGVTSEPRILVLEWWAFFWVSLFAAWITVWTPQYWRLVQDYVVKPIVDRRDHRRSAEQHEDGGPDNVLPGIAGGGQQGTELRTLEGVNINGQTPRTEDGEEDEEEHHGADGLRLDLEQSHAPEEVVAHGVREFWAILRYVWSNNRIRLHVNGPVLQQITEKARRLWENFLNKREELFSITMIVSFCATVFAAFTAAATAVAHLELDNIALSTSPDCGYWQSHNSAKLEIFALNRAEEQTANYYQNCYEMNPSLQDCNLYARRELFSRMTDNDDCPFKGDVCLLGNKSAISFDTGYVDSKYLGINSRQRPFYRRRTVCAPLVTDGYVNVINHFDTLFQTQFYYGPLKVANFTWEQWRIFGIEGSQAPMYQVVVRKAEYCYGHLHRESGC